MSKTYCSREVTLFPAPCLDGFSEVGASWRRIAVSTPALWTHIDISVGGYRSRRYESTTLHLSRSGHLPVHMHIYDSEKYDNSSTNASEPDQLIAFLRPHLPRVGTLDLESRSAWLHFFEPIVGFWLENGVIGSTSTLSVCTPEVTVLLPESLFARLSKRSKNVLSRLRALRLHNTAFCLDSAPYRDLLELQLSSGPEQLMGLPISQLATIISSCPQLKALKLVHLAIYESYGWEVPTAVNLEALEVLNVVGLGQLSLDLLLPLISVPKHTAKLSVGITLNHRNKLNGDIQAFFMRCPITTLYLDNDRASDEIHWVSALLSWLPNLENLALRRCTLKTLFLLEDASESVPPVQPDGSQRQFLRKIYFIQCAVSITALTSLNHASHARVIHLQDCSLLIDGLINRGRKMTQRLAELRSECPNLELVFSEKDSIQWPCRTVFSRLT
ncbi:hypothetical protein BDV93DRAFT_529625 [Ceratobasidium sp. AG-I]|nr:hypothetical protein BDV93DRAFT_529625 [Ceratobasidium sp. AG-I]